MKDKSIVGLILIELFLAAGVIWGLWQNYMLLGYGLLVYLVINTLAILLKLFGGKNDQNGGE